MTDTGYWESKTYQSGKVGEKVKYFVPYKRAEKRGKSSREKIASNANNVTRKVARLINDNFTARDSWVSLTYDETGYARVLTRAAGMDAEVPEVDRIWLAAAKELELALDRARKLLRKQGVELRYLAITSDTDGDTGELVRVHHHVILGAECVDALAEKWPWGDGHMPDHLRNIDDYTPLAEYLMKQVRYIRDAKKYTPSRNLIRTPAKRPRKCLSGAQLRPPKGCVLLYADPYTGKRDCQYIRYLLPQEEWTGVRRREGYQDEGNPSVTAKGGDSSPRRRAKASADAGRELSDTARRAGAGAGASCAGTSKGDRADIEQKVLCRKCGRLLGVVREDGIFENKHGRQIIRAERAVAVCPKCGTERQVGAAEKK